MPRSSISLVLKIFWLLTGVASFVFMPFWWAVFSLVYLAVLNPIFGTLIFAPFKKLFKAGSEYPAFIGGVLEAVLVVLIFVFTRAHFDAPKHLLLFLLLEYAINQINRMYRTRDNWPNEWERAEMIGFLVALLPIAFLTSIFFGLGNTWTIFSICCFVWYSIPKYMNRLQIKTFTEKRN